MTAIFTDLGATQNTKQVNSAQSPTAGDFAAVLLSDVDRVAAASRQLPEGNIEFRSRAGKSERRTVQRAKAEVDPTAVATAQLATHGPMKATVDSAVNEQTTAKPPSESAPRRHHASAGPKSEPAPRCENPNGQTKGEHPRPSATGAPNSAAPQRPATSPPVKATEASAGPRAQSAQGNAVPPVTPAAYIARALRVAVSGPATPAAPRAIPRADAAHPNAKAPTTKPAAASKQLPEPRTVDEKFAEQLGRGFAAVLRQSGGSLTMRLQPKELGDMTIRLDLKPGQVAADFEVNSEQARKLLGEQLSSLRSALEARGLDVEQLTVRVSDRPTPEATGTRQAESWPFSNGGTGNWEGGGAAGHNGTRAGQDRLVAVIPAKSAPARSVAEPQETPSGAREASGGAPAVALDAVA